MAVRSVTSFAVNVDHGYFAALSENAESFLCAK